MNLNLKFLTLFFACALISTSIKSETNYKPLIYITGGITVASILKVCKEGLMIYKISKNIKAFKLQNNHYGHFYPVMNKYIKEGNESIGKFVLYGFISPLGAYITYRLNKKITS